MKSRYLFAGLLILAVPLLHGASGPTTYRIERKGDGWVLLRSGVPFFVKGAVGLQYLDRLRENGGNAVRLWGRLPESLDAAAQRDLAVLVSLPLRGERDGMDWNSQNQIQEQRERILTIVREVKDHPAVMMYALGNELDWIPPGKPYNRKLWNVINDLAREIHRMDPHHPVMTVVGDSDFATKIVEIARQCPNLDLLGINSYGNIREIAGLVRKHWAKPYMPTEWGPVGHWQVKKTDWGAPREQTSSEKAQSYLDHYVDVIQGDSANCLGSFVFLWGQKQEITHTWYGMFSLDGLASEAVGVMRYVWTGRWPENRAPKIQPPKIESFAAGESVRLRTGARHTASVSEEDPDGDPVRFHWEIKAEVEPAPYAGIGEKPAEPIPGLIEDASQAEVSFSAPRTPGAYRLFVYAFDGKGHWAYANLPFLVTEERSSNADSEVQRWGVYEVVLKGPESGNPFMDVTLTAVFSHGDKSIKVPGFYDGNSVYRLRFPPDSEGAWTYQTESNRAGLSNQKGAFRCIAPSGVNHGPVKIVNTHYLQYADGTPYYAIGTTAYQWTSVKQSIQEKTLATLRAAPFNKIRMLVFPKSYKYGNETEPWAYPFAREDNANDFHRPNYAFFQNFDRRVAELMDMGIQADVILFHPYDRWGYSKMGGETNERYVRYMIARLAAYRNVWWSLANEWDIPGFKEAIDWEAIGSLLEKEDPYQRLRGIHNWYGSEDHFYDHSRHWITHVSAQTSQFYNAIKWRSQYQKPLLFDEMRYEGGVPDGWGNLSAEEMTSYFWMAGSSGGYPTHGETYRNHADDATEVRWWAKGGMLAGTSPQRIAFFKSVMEEAPVTQMTPALIAGKDPKNGKTNVYVFSRPGAYHLVYSAAGGGEVEVDLGEGDFSMELIDTWNMEITPSERSFSGKALIELPSKPYMALRFVRRQVD